MHLIEEVKPKGITFFFKVKNILYDYASSVCV